MKALRRLRASISVFAVVVSTIWVVGFAFTASPWPPQILDPPLRVLVNRWPEACEEVLMGGGPRHYVSVDLGFRHTAWQDVEEFDVDLDRNAFEAKVRDIIFRLRWLVASDIGATSQEKAVALAEISATLSPPSLYALYRAYVSQNARVTGVDPLHTLRWLLTLALPPIAILALGIGMQRSKAG